jgi:integrase
LWQQAIPQNLLKGLGKPRAFVAVRPKLCEPTTKLTALSHADTLRTPRAMAQKQELTDALVARLPTPMRGNEITYDAHKKAPRGFGVRVTAGGSRSFVLNYRCQSDGLERRMTIGTFPAYSVAAARLDAAAERRKVDSGRDPLGEREAIRKAETVAELCDRFEEEHIESKRQSTQRDYKAAVAIVRAELGSLKVAEVSFSNIDKLHRRITKGQHRGGKRPAPYVANRVIAVLSKMFSLAIKWGIRSDNPARGIERNPEDKRERHLSDDELARLMEALAQHDDQQAVNIIRLLLLTGARSGEVKAARWEQFDLTKGTWTRPAATTKTNKLHHVPLSAPARQLLAQIRKEAEAAAKKSGKEISPYVFPASKSKKRSTDFRAEIKDSWATLCKEAQIIGLRIHDLRHSFASMLVNAGLSLPTIGALLGHTQVQTTNRYSHLITDVLQKATDRVGAKIANVGRTPRAKVIQLR